MNIKRYEPVFGNGAPDAYSGEMIESPTGDYYSRADLIAAGCLVPVPDGEACEISKIAICGCFLFNGTVFRLYSFSREEFGAWQLSDHTEHLFAPDTIVHPVRLVALEEVAVQESEYDQYSHWELSGERPEDHT